MEKLVSILTPCYNGEKYIRRLLDSILDQTYPRIEMFVIDDGSTDNSANIIKSYIPRFEVKGYSLTYLYQENAGQSVAINKGLKLITGDYLIWPDCDDWYAVNDAIQQMVACLNDSDYSVSMVRCQSYVLEENTLKQIGKFCVNKATKGKIDLFEDCLFHSNGFWYGAGNYMAKTSKIEETIPNKEIFTDKYAGQNWQLMLPLLYKNKCLTIEKFLHNILARKDSHSRGQYSTLEQNLKRYDSYEKNLLFTMNNIENMQIAEKEKYQHAIKNIYKEICFILFISHKRYKNAFDIFFKSNYFSKKKMVIVFIKKMVKRVFGSVS